MNLPAATSRFWIFACGLETVESHPLITTSTISPLSARISPTASPDPGRTETTTILAPSPNFWHFGRSSDPNPVHCHQLAVLYIVSRRRQQNCERPNLPHFQLDISLLEWWQCAAPPLAQPEHEFNWCVCSFALGKFYVKVPGMLTGLTLCD